MSEVSEKVRAIVADKLGIDIQEVKDEANFTTDLGADSLDTVEMIMDFEKEFNISIPEEEAEHIKTVGEAIEHIESAVKK